MTRVGSQRHRNKIRPYSFKQANFIFCDRIRSVGACFYVGNRMVLNYYVWKSLLLMDTNISYYLFAALSM